MRVKQIKAVFHNTKFSGQFILENKYSKAKHLWPYRKNNSGKILININFQLFNKLHSIHV